MPRVSSLACVVAGLLSCGECYRDEEKARNRKLTQVAIDSQANVAVLAEEHKSHVDVALVQQHQVTGGNTTVREEPKTEEPQPDSGSPPESPKPEDFKCSDRETTRYDVFLKDMLPIAEGAKEMTVDDKTLIFVVAMQNDFVFGSLGLPCLKVRDALQSKVAQFIEKASGQGATILSSMDFHPLTHCSFKADAAAGNASKKDACKNEFFFTDAEKKDMTRYKNEFPQHASYEVKDGKVQFVVTPADSQRGWETDFKGAALADPVREALDKASKAHKDRVFEMFQGFSESIDSFAAFPHQLEGGAFEPFTGAFVPADEAKALTGTESHCFEKDKDQEAGCLPTEEQMKDTPKMTSVEKLFAAWAKREAKFQKVLIVGLVYDYSVKETAMALSVYFKGKEHAPEVVVVADWARPAHEGSNMEPNAATFGVTAVDMNRTGVRFARATSEDKLFAVELDYEEDKDSAVKAPVLFVTAALVMVSFLRL